MISAGYDGLWATDLKDGSTRWLDKGDIRGVGFAGPSALIVGHWAKGGTFLLQIAKKAAGPLLIAIPVGTVFPSSETLKLVGLLGAGASLTADICEPLLNPVNGRPIGANCGHRRGSVTFRRVRNDSLIGKITTHYAATRINDVLANFNLPVYVDARDNNQKSPIIRLRDGLQVTLELAHFRQENYVENQGERSHTTVNAQVMGQPVQPAAVTAFLAVPTAGVGTLGFIARHRRPECPICMSIEVAEGEVGVAPLAALRRVADVFAASGYSVSGYDSVGLVMSAQKGENLRRTIFRLAASVHADSINAPTSKLRLYITKIDGGEADIRGSTHVGRSMLKAIAATLSNNNGAK